MKDFCKNKGCKEHLLMQMSMHKDYVDRIETIRPNMKPRNTDGVKFKIMTTSPYYHIVYFWEQLQVVAQTSASKSGVCKRIKVL